jgi:magnesium chelatase subunit ChlI-like protein
MAGAETSGSTADGLVVDTHRATRLARPLGSAAHVTRWIDGVSRCPGAGTQPHPACNGLHLWGIGGKTVRAADVLTITPSCPTPRADRSRLARHLTSILPAMTRAETMETTRIPSGAGLTGDRTALVTTRPCRVLPIIPSRLWG